MKTKNESNVPSTSGQPTREERWKAAIICVVVGVITTAILITATHSIARTQYGQNCEFWMYGLLQGALSDFDPNNPVVLIDIGNVSENSEDLVPVVHELVTKLKTLHKRPVAIAVDVDFSPTGALPSNTIEFFDACLRKPSTDDVPVFLGVGDNKSALPEEWLGLEKYKELAAAVAINRRDTRWLPIWVSANEGEQLKTLNYALGLEYPGGLPGPSWLLARAVERGKEGGAVTRERREKDPNEVILNYGERLVNYSKLETMMRGVKTAAEAQSIDNENTSYSGKLVIIGDVTRALDNFPIPGPRDDKPGSLLLASATYTLIKEPLFEFKSKVKLGFDLFTVAVIVFLVAFLRYRNPFDSSWVGKQAIFIYASIILVGIIGYSLVRFGRVMWPDFLFVLFALLLHPKVDRLVHPIVDLLIIIGSKLKSKLKSLRRSPPPATGSIVNVLVAGFSATLIMAAGAHAQQPADRCERGIGAIAVELKHDAKSKNKKLNYTCQYCDSGKDEWNDLSEGDLGKQFRPGQRLRCSKRCTLIIFVCGSGKNQPIRYIEAKTSDGKTVPGWYTVINVYRIPRRILGDRDRYPDIPAKPIKWSYIPPANPDPRTVNALADYSAAVASLYPVEMAKKQADVAQPLPTPDVSQSKTAAVAPAGIPSAQATPTATPVIREQIARISSPTTSAATVAATRPTGEPSAGVSGSETSAEEQRKQLIEFMSLLNRGNAERDAQNYAAAQTAYREANALISSDPRSWYGLGNVYFDQQRWTEAEQAYRNATTLSAYSPQVYLALAKVLINSQEGTGDLSRLSEAEKNLLIAVRQNPRNEAVYTLLDIVLKKRGATPDELEASYREALQYYPTSLGTNLRLARLLAPVKPKEAKKYWNMAEKTARTPEELLDVATALESRNKLDKAERFAHRALKLEPGNARAHLLVGLVLIDREKYSAALPSLQKAAKNPDDFVSRYLSGIAHLQLGDLDQSERSFDEATMKISAEEDPYAIAYWSTLLGDAYVQKGRKSDAVRVYEKALKQDPDDLETREKLTKTRSTMEQ